ncbi:5770_t:CDS:2 [Funneliformis geosporum]|uniref:7560_t:CDS:1 n=1 Tax=Funneliformis geosporum TaxID=1117311 RepID=A0A9W4SVF7_9GLOM|nr:5770_t:CDS:2 [Funneliformis geosporum]CAI2182851.1 7560_t:CDS:2 [Funneliformis geosporum]
MVYSLNYATLVKYDNNENVMVTVNNPISIPTSVHLNPKDNLSIIRAVLLEKHKIISNKLSFSKFSQNNNVRVLDEKGSILDEVIVKNQDDYNLYLMYSNTWEFLNYKHKLDYGRTMTDDGIKTVYTRGFIMKFGEVSECGAKGCVEDRVEISSIGSLKRELTKLGSSLSYIYTNYGKISLKIKDIIPTDELINYVDENTRDLERPDNLFKITKKFGEFIPTEVILGGRTYFEDYKNSADHSNESSKDFNINAANAPNVLDAGLTVDHTNKKENSNLYQSNRKRFIGGKQPDSLTNFEESAWIKSLEDYKNWDCIEFQSPISIFKHLPRDLHPEIYNLPLNISEILDTDENDDYDIFASIIDTDESNELFHCHVYWPSNK